MSKRLDKYVLNIQLKSPEGIHDFIEMLEDIKERIKGGVEKHIGVIDGKESMWEINSEWK